MKNKGTLWRVILLAAMGIVIGSAVFNWNARTLAGDRMPMPLGYGASVVLSGSMEPELSVDDLVIVKKTDKINVGDVIVFQSEQDLIIHRVVKLDGDTVTTRGDANNRDDDPISRKNIKGVMVCAIPKVGVAVDFLRQPVVVVAILLAAFALTELSYRKEKDRDQDELEQLKAQIRELAKEISDHE